MKIVGLVSDVMKEGLTGNSFTCKGTAAVVESTDGLPLGRPTDFRLPIDYETARFLCEQMDSIRGMKDPFKSLASQPRILITIQTENDNHENQIKR